MLPQTIEYGLRAMAYLASRGSVDEVRAADIASAANIPRHYVAKLLRRLVVADLLVSQRGRGGGFSLSRPASEIRFIDIMRALDFEVSSNHCAFGYDRCRKTNPCPLHGAWDRLKGALLEWGETTTLAEAGAIDALRPR